MRDARPAQALGSFYPVSLSVSFPPFSPPVSGEEANERSAMSVNSACQLSKMFLSLHVVFLSLATVESSASTVHQKGKTQRYRLFAAFLFSFVVKTAHSITRVIIILVFFFSPLLERRPEPGL